MNKYDKYYTFTQGQFDALVSFVYNLGEKNLHTLLQNGIRSKKEISNKLLEYINVYNTTTEKYERSEGLYNRRLKEKELFDKTTASNSGIEHIITELMIYKLDLGKITTYLVKENQIEQTTDVEEDMNIIYYDLNGNTYRTKCKYSFNHPSYVLVCVNTESIQQKGNYYIKLNEDTKILNGDIITSFDSKNFNGNQYAEFNIIDSFAKLQITHFYDLYYRYYTVYAYGTYFSYFFRLTTKLKDDKFPTNFPLRIYMYFTSSSIKTEELNCFSSKLSLLEDDFDYEYIISCSGDSSGNIYETRGGNNYLQFRAFYQPYSVTAYNPLIMSANPKNINNTNPLSVIKIQKYEISYIIVKSLEELENLENNFKGIYIKNKPENIINEYYDYGIYFITNNDEKLNTKCLINILENNEVKLKCKINVENLSNFMNLKDGIYNSYIFISKLDIDYVFNYRKTDMVILERFNIDIGGTILISRIDDKTTINDLKKDVVVKNEDIQINNNEENKENTEKDNNKNNKDGNSINKKDPNNQKNGKQKFIINKFILIIFLIFMF